jgi:hypothetical protein
VSSYVPTAAQLAGLLGIVAVAAMFIALGAAVGGRQRRAEADLVAGWGIVDAAFVALGAIAGIALGWILAAVIAAAIACAAIALRRMDRSDARGLMMWAALSIPLVLVVAAMAPSQWDEFTHWLPHTRYLLEHGDFVRAGMPPPSPQAAYPYGLPLVSTMASRLAGHFVENGAAIFNVLLLGNFGLVVARVIADARGGQKVGWGLTALGLLAAVALNPTFVPKIVFTAYADSATAVVLGIAAVLAWRALNALADGDPAKARALAWQLGLAATALVWLKQANLPLLGALMVAAALVALVDRRIAFVAALGLAVRALALPLAVWVLWRIYLAHNLPGGEFEVRPFAQWALALLPDVVGRMASIASKKGGYFGIMIIAVGFAVRGLIRPRTPFDRLAIIVGVTFLLYNLFLLFTYIASFGDNDAMRAASYWRYNTHLGGICVVFAAYAVALLWRWPMARAASWAAIALVAIAPLALAKTIRFDDRAPKRYVRAVGAEIDRMLRPSDRIVLIDSTSAGELVVIMHYALHGRPRVIGDVTTAAGGTIPIPPGTTHVWVHVPTPAVEAALDAKLPSGASYLLARMGGRWAIEKSWSYPGYRLPTDVPD